MAIIPIQHLVDIKQPEKPIRYTAIKGDYFKCRKIVNNWNRPMCNACADNVQVGDEYYRHIQTKGLRKDSWQYRSKHRELQNENIVVQLCKTCYGNMPDNQQRQQIH